MNCKPGDLAIVMVDEDFPNNIGQFVQVIHRVEDLEGFPAWEVRPLGVVMCWDFPGRSSGSASLTVEGELIDWADCELKPIRPPAKEVTSEVIQRIGTPHKEVA